MLYLKVSPFKREPKGNTTDFQLQTKTLLVKRSFAFGFFKNEVREKINEVWEMGKAEQEIIELATQIKGLTPNGLSYLNSILNPDFEITSNF